MTSHRRERSVILLYHSLGIRSPAVMEEKFRQQVAWLSENATLLPLGDLLCKPEGGGLRVAITFDDGYASLHDQVAPILADYGAVATVFINTAWIGETIRLPSDVSEGHYPEEHFLTWREVEFLAKAGWTIGSHGVRHLDLTRQDAVVVTQELSEAKIDIESHLGCLCEYFAYTWGRNTPGLQRAVQMAGYVKALSTLHAPVLSTSNSYALPRIDIQAEYEIRDFVDAVTGRWDFLCIKQSIAEFIR